MDWDSFWLTGAGIVAAVAVAGVLSVIERHSRNTRWSAPIRMALFYPHRLAPLHIHWVMLVIIAIALMFAVGLSNAPD